MVMATDLAPHRRMIFVSRLTAPVLRCTACALAMAAAAGATTQLHAPAPARAATAPAVGTSFSRPTMNSPVRIRLHRGTDKLHLKDNHDYILKMPARKKTGPLYIKGGGDVEIIGGLMSTKVEGPNINIRDDAGTRNGRIVHIEGVLINGSSRVPADGIKIQAPHTIVQLENDRIVGLHGKLRGYHADVIQPGGGVKALRIDGLTGSSHYNNLYLRRETNPLKPPIGKVTIRNANFRGYHNSGHRPRTTLRAISIGTQASPPSNDSQAINCNLTNRVILKNVWMTPPRGVRAANFVYPHDRMEGAAKTCHSKLSSGVVFWPHWRSDGKVIGGLHTGHHADFVPKGVAGLGY
jgi:hypothetical protein